MTPHQIELVQSSFSLVEPTIEPAAMMFYDRLFQLDPSLRRVFRTPQAEQARKLAQVLTVVVKSLSRPEQILPAVEDLGRRHSNVEQRVSFSLIFHAESGGRSGDSQFVSFASIRVK